MLQRDPSRARRLKAILALLALSGAAAEAAAFVPPAAKVTEQVAAGNRKASRAHSLVLSVALRGPDERTIARGELMSDPHGLARLELSGDGGNLERHLLRGGEHLAARGGSLLSGPAPYLPPLFFLQAGSGERLLSGLVSLGALEEAVLGRFEDAVCYVLGGRDLAPPANESAALVGSPGPKAAIWVEREGFRIVRIDALDGTRYVLGPERSFDGTTLPGWVRIERPGVPATRLEILGARRGRFDLAVTFGMDWLLGH